MLGLSSLTLHLYKRALLSHILAENGHKTLPTTNQEMISKRIISRKIIIKMNQIIIIDGMMAMVEHMATPIRRMILIAAVLS